MRPSRTQLIAATVACVLVASATTALAQKMPADTKHPAIDALPDIGPEAKRQANYMLTEVVQFFQRIDKIMASDNTTKAHMDNAYSRATQRSIDAWQARRQKILDAYARWAKSHGKNPNKMGPEWHAFSKMISDFLGDLQSGRGMRAISWRREINSANKRFKRWTKSAPRAMKLYKDDLAIADKAIDEAEGTLAKSVARLDDLKRNRRHLVKARRVLKNLQGHMVREQKRGKDIIADKQYKPETFKKGLDEIIKWKTECEANTELNDGLKACPRQWAKHAQKAFDDYKKNYTDTISAVSDFVAGTIFKDSNHFRGVDYGSMVDVVNEAIEKVDARIAKITG